MKVTNPTITTLTVNWNPADGNVQGYKVIYVPEDGGEEVVVSSSSSTLRKERFTMTRWRQPLPESLKASEENLELNKTELVISDIDF